MPRADAVVDWLQRNAVEIAPILDVDLRAEPCVVFDLGVGSPLVSGDAAANEAPALGKRLSEEMRSASARVGVGQYDEARLLYTGALFAPSDAPTGERRTVHLGIDLFCAAGTPVCAPLEATVYALEERSAPQDYGPTVLLAHAAGEDG